MRQPFTGLVLCAAAGILLADQLAVDPFLLTLPLLLLALILLFRPVSWAVWVYVTAAFFLLHVYQYWESPGRLLAQDLKGKPAWIAATGVVVTEPDPARDVGPKTKTTLRLRLRQIRIGPLERPETAVILVRWLGYPPAYGDLVSFKAPAAPIAPPRNPGQFDFAGYMDRLGIETECDIQEASHAQILAHDQGNPLRQAAYISRAWLQSRLASDLEDSPEIAGLIQSLVLGLKSETPESTRELFQRTGTLHLFVVNGLHVGMFAAVAWLILAPTGLSRRHSVFVLIPLLAFYTLVTGLSIGSIRATIMAAIVLGSYVVERRPVPLNSLAAAAFLILAMDTDQLFMPGFQFSFGVVASIILLAGRIQRGLTRWADPDPFIPEHLLTLWQRFLQFVVGHAGALLAVSTAAWIGSLPFTAGYIHLFTPSAVAANFVIVPAAFCILFNGILSLLAGILSATLGNLFNNANWLAAHLLLWLVHFFARIPGGYLYVETPRLDPAACEITILDVQGGGATHLRANGSDWLIDTGSGFEYDSVVRPFLRMRGVNTLAGLLLTQDSPSRSGAAPSAGEDFQPAQILSSPLRDPSKSGKALQSRLASLGIGRAACERGDSISAGQDAVFHILYPPAGIVPRSENDKGLIIRIDCRGLRLLFAQQCGSFTEHWLLDHEPDLAGDLLVKGEQTKDMPSLSRFIGAVHPSVIVSTAYSFYGSARGNKTLESETRARGIAFFRQDKAGAVRIEIGDSDWAVSSFLGDQTFRKSIR